jgi:hypothetical protein
MDEGRYGQSYRPVAADHRSSSFDRDIAAQPGGCRCSASRSISAPNTPICTDTSQTDGVISLACADVCNNKPGCDIGKVHNLLRLAAFIARVLV